MLLTVFVCKLTKTASHTAGRIELPSAALIGRAYHCNHPLQDRTLLQLTIEAKDEQRSQFSLPPHPLCCQSSWARAAYYMAARRIVRSNVNGRDKQLQAWQAIVTSLASLLPLPPPDAFWDIHRERPQPQLPTKRPSAPCAPRAPRASSAPGTKLKRKIPSRPLQSRKLQSRPLQSRPLQSRPLQSRPLRSKPLAAGTKPEPRNPRPIKIPRAVKRQPATPRPTKQRPAQPPPAPERPASQRPTSQRPTSQRPASPPTAPSGVSDPSSTSKRQLPECFWLLGFEVLPTRQELRRRFLQLATVVHPDMKGDKLDFQGIKSAYESAVQWLDQNPLPSSRS